MKKQITIDVNVDGLKVENVNIALKAIIENTDFDKLASIYGKSERASSLKKEAINALTSVAMCAMEDPLEVHNTFENHMHALYIPHYDTLEGFLEEANFYLLYEYCSADAIVCTETADDVDPNDTEEMSKYPFDFIWVNTPDDCIQYKIEEGGK